MKIQDNLTREDLQKWGKDLITYFVVPVAIVFLTSLQTGNLQLALGSAYGTAIACAINLLSKYKEGVDLKDLQTYQFPNQPATTSVASPEVKFSVVQVEPTETKVGE